MTAPTLFKQHFRNSSSLTHNLAMSQFPVPGEIAQEEVTCRYVRVAGGMQGTTSLWLQADRPSGMLLFSPLAGTDDTVPLFREHLHNHCTQACKMVIVKESNYVLFLRLDNHSHHHWRGGDSKVLHCFQKNIYLCH